MTRRYKINAMFVMFIRILKRKRERERGEKIKSQMISVMRRIHCSVFVCDIYDELCILIGTRGALFTPYHNGIN